jgi:hypothetical protein
MTDDDVRERDRTRDSVHEIRNIVSEVRTQSAVTAKVTDNIDRTMTAFIATTTAGLAERALKSELAALAELTKEELEKRVTKAEWTPFKLFLIALIGSILLAVIAAVMGGVVRTPGQ